MTVHPFGPRIAVVEPTMERERESGLIVVSNEVNVDTGVVVTNPFLDGGTIGSEFVGMGFTELREIPLGALVYYVKGSGVRIGSENMIDIKAIIAWEEY